MLILCSEDFQPLSAPPGDQMSIYAILVLLYNSFHSDLLAGAAPLNRRRTISLMIAQSIGAVCLIGIVLLLIATKT